MKINLDVKLLKNCVCLWVSLFVYLFVCLCGHMFTHVCMFSSNYAAACDFISFEWLDIFQFHIILSQMIFWVWHIFILTLFCLLVVIFIWKVNTLYGFDLSWYLNGILFTLYKYTMIAHVLRDKFSIPEGISVKNMLIRLGWICRKNYIICIMFPEQFIMVI